MENDMVAAFAKLIADPAYGGRYVSITPGHANFIGNYNRGLVIIGAAWTPSIGLDRGMELNTVIEIAGASFRFNEKGGIKIHVGCTVQRYVVTRCTFDENHVYDLALAGWPSAYNAKVGGTQILDSKVNRILADDNKMVNMLNNLDNRSIKLSRNYYSGGIKDPDYRFRHQSENPRCLHRNVTIRDVYFDRIFQEGKAGAQSQANLPKI